MLLLYCLPPVFCLSVEPRACGEPHPPVLDKVRRLGLGPDGGCSQLCPRHQVPIWRESDLQDSEVRWPARPAVLAWLFPASHPPFVIRLVLTAICIPAGLCICNTYSTIGRSIAHIDDPRGHIYWDTEVNILLWSYIKVIDWCTVLYVVRMYYSTVSVQQMNLLPEQAAQINTKFAHSLYRWYE